MISPAILSALAAWFVGLLIDANIGFPDGFLMLRILLPMLVLGGFILKNIQNSKNK